MAALLTSVKDDKDKMAIYLNECRRMKIQVLPPDVNESDAELHPGRARHPVRPDRDPQRRRQRRRRDRRRAASEKGRFADFNDFLDKVPALVCNKRVIESLIKAGAFDDMKHRRRALVAIHETAVDQYVDIKRNEAIGQDSLFGGLDDDAEAAASGSRVTVPDIDEWDKKTLLGHERDMLGLYVSDHPLLGLEHVLATAPTAPSASCCSTRSGPTAPRSRSPGWSPSVQRKITKRGDAWAMVTLEDLEGAIDVLLFPSAYQLASTLPRRGRDPHGQGPALARARTSPSCTARRSRVPDLSDGPVGPGRDQPAVDPVHRAGRRAAQGRARHPPRASPRCGCGC